MKNIKYIFVFILIISSGLTFKAFAQTNILTQGTPNPSVPNYVGGTLITIPYSMEFLMLTGNQAELNITYPANLLDFVSSDLTSSGIWTLTSSPGNIVYQTSAFSAADNNYTSATDFTLTFRVTSNSCTQLSGNIVTTLSTLGGATPASPVPVSMPLQIQNNGAGGSVDMSLWQGDECSIAMYEINSFGLDTLGNSNFELTLPAGATLQGVFNTIGDPVAFITSGFGPIMYTWQRSGVPNEKSQQHFVLIEFDQAVLCANGGSNYQMSLDFKSHEVCSPYSIFSVSDTYNFTACCNQTPPNINGVILRKSLIKHPLRYFPSPDNCKTHDYIIKVFNLTPNNLDNFVLNDFLDDIVPGFQDEIEVTQITASLNSIIPSASFICKSFIGTYLNPSITLSVAGGPIVIFPSIVPPNNSNSNFNLKGQVFPKYSTLTVKITHKLGTDPLTSYKNLAKLDFTVGSNSYTGDVTLISKKDKFEPFITLEKKVKNVTNSSPFSSSVSADPGDNLEFRIKIKNYGMANVTGAVLRDMISEIFPNGNSPSNFTPPISFAVSGTGYSPAETTLIQTGLTYSSTMNPSDFSTHIATIHAAPCTGYTELVITYQTSVKQNVTCNSIYTNKAQLKYTFNNNPFIKESSASVNIDLFKNIDYKLEASCVGPNGPWLVNNINGIPGKPIWYKASLKNNNNYPVTDLKMMVQLPSQPNLISNQGSINLVSSAPPTPTGTNLHPELGSVVTNDSYSISGTNTATSGWLNGPGVLPTNIPTANVALYKVIHSLGAGATTSIVYKVKVPINTLGAQYKTALGVSRSSSNGCPIVKQRALILTVASSDDCGNSISDCELILFDSIVERDVSDPMRFKFTLSNMINNYIGFNINNFDIVVHQPYTNIGTSSPYSMQMVGYRLNKISSVLPPFTFPLGILVSNGRRYHKVNSIISNLGFGNVNFDIITNLPTAHRYRLTFPVNIIFRDSSKPCTICEKTIYLPIMIR